MAGAAKEFCMSTSLHGWPHLPAASNCEKFFWLAAIAGSLGAAVYFTTNTVTQFTSSTVVTNIQSTTEDVTIAQFPKIVLRKACQKKCAEFGPREGGRGQSRTLVDNPSL